MTLHPRVAALAVLAGALLGVTPAARADAPPLSTQPLGAETLAQGLTPVEPVRSPLDNGAGAGFSSNLASLAPVARESIALTNRHHGLPLGVRVPAWASATGQRPYFAPTPRDLGLGQEGRPGLAAGAASPFGGVTGGSRSGKLDASLEGGGAPKPEGSNAASQEGGGESGQRGDGEALGKRGTHEPPMRYLGGVVQHEPVLHIVFWGSNWEQEPGRALQTQLLRYYNGLSGSGEQGILTQYFDPGARVTSHVSVDSVVDTRITAPTNADEGMVEEEVRYAEARLGSRNLESQFIVITAPGSTYQASFAEGYCAYHDIDREGAIYSFVPYAGDEPFRNVNYCLYYGRGDAGKATNVMASHEYAESVTDPLWDTRPGWRNLESSEGEISDICATAGDELANGSYVQGWWDDNQSRCSQSDSHPAEVLAITEDATNLTATTATLNAVLNPESMHTVYHFEYGPTASYGSRLPATEAETSVGSGRENISVSRVVSGLQLEHVYHYRVVATNASGTSYGEDRTVIPSRWTIQTPAKGASWGESWLNAVSCASVDACMSVGYFYDGANSPANQALSYQLSAGRWVQQPVPVTAGEATPELASVSCAGANDCTAVGATQRSAEVPLIERWNGAAWTAQEAPKGNTEESWLAGVSCPSMSECLAVGGAGKERNREEGPYALLWRNGRWSAVSAPASPDAIVSHLISISCSSTTFCAAVGTDWTKTSNIRPFTAIWNGSEWTFERAARVEGSGGNEEGTTFGVSCNSPGFCMAVGRFHYAPFAESWNGSKWSMVTTAPLTDASGGYLASVSCDSPSACSSVGAGWSTAPESAAVGLTLEETWNGTAWAEQTTPRENERANNELGSVSCPLPTSCVAVGLAKFGRDNALVEDYEEAPASTMPPGTTGHEPGTPSPPPPLSPPLASHSPPLPRTPPPLLPNAASPLSTAPKAPVITSAAQSSPIWRENGQHRQGSTKPRLPLGSTFSLVLNQSASVTFTFDRELSGRGVNGRCVTQTRRNGRRPACERITAAGSITFAGIVGVNRFGFGGRISATTRLAPGRYTVLITAEAAGQKSATKTLSFTIMG